MRNREPARVSVFVVDWLGFLFNDVISSLDKVPHTGVRRDLKKGNGIAANQSCGKKRAKRLMKEIADRIWWFFRY